MMSQQISRYNQVIQNKATQHGATTVDFFVRTDIFTNTATLAGDGNHPNAAGYDQIAPIWFAKISAFLAGSNATPTATQPANTTPTATKPATTATPSIIYLPLILKPGSMTTTQTATTSANTPTATTSATTSAKTPTPTATTGTPSSSSLVQPADVVYQGAFRLPDDGERPKTFAYGGNGMTFNPNGDSTGASDGYPGSLFITGHDRMPYGDLPNGSQVAEVNIPKPVKATNVNDLGMATFVQAFQDVAKGFFTELNEIPRLGLAYLDTPATGPKIHIAGDNIFNLKMWLRMAGLTRT